MQHIALGRTGLKVSRLCLGTMQLGWTADRDTSFAILDAFVAAGGNFIDTADIYSRWAPGNPGGVSETLLGEWMAERKNRHQIVLATKVRGRMWEGPGGEGLSRAHILRAVEDSLARLQTDYIDLYQTHWDDLDTPLEETQRTLDNLVSRGVVRYLGASNFAAWRLTRALWVADVHDWVPYGCLQPHYNLVHRAEFERELLPLCQDQGLAVLPYSPLAGGFLTGKYRRDGPVPESVRAARIQESLLTDRNLAVVDALTALGEERGATVAQLAVAWLLAKPAVTAPILGANSLEQLNALLPAAELVLSAAETARLDEASAWRQ